MARTDYTGEILEDKYRIVELIGEGGMGAVYRGEHMTIGKPVAIKLLHAGLATNEEVVKRFYREAQAAAAIRHSNIIDVQDLGVSAQGDPYLVMEYLEGEGLAEHLKRTGPMDLPSACGIIEAALSALVAAHEQGIVHRDLKPDNIFLVHRPGEDLTVKLIDFGISKFLDTPDQTKLTKDGSMLGTPAYMSPEQARGLDDVDHRTDIYSMGVILYEMLTGELPFFGVNYSEFLLNMLTTEPRDPASVCNAFDEKARPILDKTLNKDPAGRYQSAEEMAAAVQALVNSEEREKHLTLLAQDMEPTIVFGEIGEIATQNTVLAKSGTGLKEILAQTPSRMVRVVAFLGRIAGWGAALVKRGVGGLAKATWPKRFARGIASLFLKIVRHEKPVVRWSPLAVLLLAVGMGMWLGMAHEKKVTISLKGVPDGAQIYFGDDVVDGPSFAVPQSKKASLLRIETEGKSPFEKRVVPQMNQTVQVRLKNKKKKTKEASNKTVAQTPVQKETKASEKDEPKKAKGGDEKKAGSGAKKKKRRKWRLRWPIKKRRKNNTN